MTDTLENRTHLSLDNYADVLALADIVRATGRCVACGADSAAVRTDALWIVHDRTVADLGSVAILCARHAAEWARGGHVVAGAAGDLQGR
ncbi:hypothetical protein [Demequina rhizosphaerae]|uniref:hypothetical protein n=1 Tax=Demequina rhizosphaerae TaxID=1638985 RepID=UPI000780A416|nr:hypothetical protein [Demequina rhizosphaerae]